MSKRSLDGGSADEKPSKSTKVDVRSPFSKPWKGSDGVLIVGDKELHIHTQTLSLASPVFEKMFNGNFKEAQTKRVPLEGKSYEIVEAMLKFIYPSINCNLDNIGDSNNEKDIAKCTICKQHHILKNDGKRRENLAKLTNLSHFSNEYMIDELSRTVRAKILQESECIEEESIESFDFILDLMKTGKDLSIREVVDNCLQEITSRSVAYTTVVYKFSETEGIGETIKERNMTNKGVDRNVKGAFLKKHAAILKRYRKYVRSDDLPVELKPGRYLREGYLFDFAVKDLEKIADDLVADNE